MKKVFESPELRVMEYQYETTMSTSTTTPGGSGAPELPDDDFDA